MIVSHGAPDEYGRSINNENATALDFTAWDHVLSLPSNEGHVDDPGCIVLTIIAREGWSTTFPGSIDNGRVRSGRSLQRYRMAVEIQPFHPSSWSNQDGVAVAGGIDRALDGFMVSGDAKHVSDHSSCKQAWHEDEDGRDSHVGGSRKCAWYSGKEIVDRFGAFDTDEFLIQSRMEVGQCIGVQAELMKDRCMQVPYVEWAILDSNQ